jgi:hypothetical protein
MTAAACAAVGRWGRDVESMPCRDATGPCLWLSSESELRPCRGRAGPAAVGRACPHPLSVQLKCRVEIDSS